MPPVIFPKRFFVLPKEFHDHGYMLHLRASSVCLYVALCREGARRNNRTFPLTDNKLMRHVPMGPKTLTKARDELIRMNLIGTTRSNCGMRYHLFDPEFWILPLAMTKTEPSSGAPSTL